MEIFQSIFLGLVQGLTEFLPVSSSGHLAIFQKLFGMQEPMLLFDILLHFATLAAVVFFFRADIANLLKAAVSEPASSGEPAESTTWPGSKKSAQLFILWVIVGTIPAGLTGLLIKDYIETAFKSLTLVGVDLMVTGLILMLVEKRAAGKRNAANMGAAGALIIGAAQAVAILPGISRSGSTICAALFLGINRKEAGRFSFLLSIPAILGATVLQLKDALETGISIHPAHILGMIAAFAAGLVALRWLIRILEGGRLTGFSIYCLILGLTAIAASIIII